MATDLQGGLQGGKDCALDVDFDAVEDFEDARTLWEGTRLRERYAVREAATPRPTLTNRCHTAQARRRRPLHFP